MPKFPETSVAGEAFYMINGHKRSPPDIIGSGICWGIQPSPRATIESKGSGGLTLTAKTLRVKIHAQSDVVQYGTWEGLNIRAPIELDEGESRGQ